MIYQQKNKLIILAVDLTRREKIDVYYIVLSDLYFAAFGRHLTKIIKPTGTTKGKVQ
jgi:hypothetical protein